MGILGRSLTLQRSDPVGGIPCPAALLDSAALGSTGVCEAFTLHGDKLPIVSLLLQAEFEHAEGLVVVDLRVGDRVWYLIEAPAPGAHHKLPDAILGIHPPLGVLRGKALVVVVVSV